MVSDYWEDRSRESTPGKLVTMSATPKGLDDVITCGGCGATAPKQHPQFPHLTMLSFLSCGNCKRIKAFARALWQAWYAPRPTPVLPTATKGPMT